MGEDANGNGCEGEQEQTNYCIDEIPSKFKSTDAPLGRRGRPRVKGIGDSMRISTGAPCRGCGKRVRRLYCCGEGEGEWACLECVRRGYPWIHITGVDDG